MFSGIVEALGVITHCDTRPGGTTLTLRLPAGFDDLKIGDSLAVNGVCLTVVRWVPPDCTVELAPETLRKTTLGSVRQGDHVNLERSLVANGRIGGHFVQGHIDSTAEVIALQPDGEGVMVTFKAPADFMRYIVSKGYVALDGMSLTVVETGPDWFTISFIAHTRAVTVVQYYTPGWRVNLEVDVLGKYVEKIVAHRQ